MRNGTGLRQMASSLRALGSRVRTALRVARFPRPASVCESRKFPANLVPNSAAWGIFGTACRQEPARPRRLDSARLLDPRARDYGLGPDPCPAQRRAES